MQINLIVIQEKQFLLPLQLLVLLHPCWLGCGLVLATLEAAEDVQGVGLLWRTGSSGVGRNCGILVNTEKPTG